MAKDNESTMKWKVDVSELKKGMQDAKRAISLANAEFKNATAGLGKWSTSVTGVEAKIKQLNKTNESQKTILANLQKQYEIVAREMGEDSAEAQRLKIQIENQQAAIKKTDAQLKTYKDELSDLQAEQKAAKTPMSQLNKTIDEQESELADLKRQYANSIVGDNPEEAKRLAKEIDSLSSELADNKKKMSDAEQAADELDKSIDEAGDSAKEAANGGFTVMKGALANLVSQGITAAVDGLRQLGSAIIDAGKQSLSSYSSYEQLTGGVDKLFGDSSDRLQQYAMDAYKTSGMSANQYMEQATSFSAALINSLGGDTEKAADMTDMAMRAMSDNVNTFGSDMSDVQNAFQGFAKQNYTMLDNLKLGYGGTQSEMQRLIDDANEYGRSIGMAGDLSMDSFADIIQAIELIQEKQNVAGTTAKEAASTMEGSTTMAKSAWENLLTAFSGGGDIDTAWDAFIESAGAVVDNWLPRIETLWNNATTFIHDKMEEVAPEFTAAFDGMVAVIRDDVIPAVKEVVDWILDNKEPILAALAGIAAGIVAMNVVSTITGIVEAFKKWKAATEGMTVAQRLLNLAQNASPIGLIISLIAGLVAAFAVLWNTSEDFRNFWIGLWEKIKKAVKPVIDNLKKWFSGAWTNIKKVWSGAKKFFTGIWNGIKAVFSAVGAWFKNIFNAAWTNVKNIWNAAKGFFTGIWTAIKNVFAPVITWFKNIFSSAWNGIKNIWNAAKSFFLGIWNGIKAVFAPVISFFKTLFGNAWTMVKNVWIVATAFFSAIWNGIKNVFSGVATWFKNIFNAAWTNIKNIWSAVKGWFLNVWNGIKNVFAPVITWFKNIFSSAWNGIKNIWNAAKGFFTGIWNGIKAVFNGVASWFRNIFSSAWNGIKSIWNGARNFFSGIWTNIKNVFNGVTTWFRNIFSNAWQAIKDVFNGVGGFFGGIWDTIKSKFSDIGTKVGDAIGGAFKRVINTILSTAETVLNAPIDGINSLIDKANSMLGLGLGRLSRFYLPRMAAGGVLNSARAVIAGEDGAEAIVPLERNKQWIAKVAKDMLAALDVDDLKRTVNVNLNVPNDAAFGNVGAANGTKQQTINFTQNNYSPKALDRLSIYRDTKSVLFSAKVGLSNV